jgi:hypothetical protein
MSKTMNDRHLRRERLAAALLLAATTAMTTVTAGAGAGHERHLGVASCASSLCHGAAKPGTVTSVEQNEYVTWSHFDPHASAYRALVEERGAAIARRLGLPNAYEARVCLDCHTDNVARAEQGPRFHVTDGVGCESCHGAAENWIATHDDVPAVTHADNLARGLRALERPSVRVEVCLDCHVGSGTQLATHRMMAAGHPRLAFELETFTELWRTSGGREHYRLDADYSKRKPVASPSEAWSAGLFATVARKLDLLNGPQFNSRSLVPELALFNCYSCHRSMRLKHWQDKGDATRDSGNPTFDDSSVRMLEALLAAQRPAAIVEELRQHEHAWQSAAGGERADAIAASSELARFVSEQRRQLEGRPLSASEARVALDYVARGAARGDYSDYASAEQAAMSVVVLLAETGASAKREPAVDELFAALNDDDHYDAIRFRQVLHRLEPVGH